jgi:hypothetical protein
MRAGRNEDRLRRLERRIAPAGTPDAFPELVPNIIEFALSDQYLGVSLYPRQATLLKLMFCSPELLTSYDHRVLEEWTNGFAEAVREDGSRLYEGCEGVVPDVLDRIETCKAQGRGWFREVIVVAGRRGSKGFLGAIAASYVLWNVMAKLDPQEYFGIAKGKQIHLMVFAGQQDQARVNQFRDVSEVIKNSAGFRPYVADSTLDTLWIYSPAQVAQGVKSPRDAAFVISARESTILSGRGQAAVVQVFDEMAHMDGGSTNRPAADMYSAATPGTAQFGPHAFLFQASSPWQQIGKFYQQYLRGLAIDPTTATAQSPDMLVVQLPSPALYEDWDLTQDSSFLAWPGGTPFKTLKGPIFDETHEAAFRSADPDGFDVEFGAQWAATQAAYLRREDIDKLFGDYLGAPVTMKYRGVSAFSYIAHADPSVSGANFALVVAHPEIDDNRDRHVVVDLIKVWEPRNFPDHRIDYEEITAYLKDLLQRFRLTRLTMDQFNSAGLRDGLQKFAVTDARVLGRPIISVKTATAHYNHQAAETFKTALARGLVHAPHHDLAELELRFLELRNGRVDHPTRGPVQTSDIADCLMAVVDSLLGDGSGTRLHEALGETSLHGMHGHPSPAHEALSSFFNRSERGAPRGPRYDPSRGRSRRGR